MYFVGTWVTPDGRTLLHFADPVLDVFSSYRQLAPCNDEAGGVLLGTVHGLHLAIAEATEPLASDVRLRYSFERSSAGHQQIADARWSSSKGTVRYLGEWHTHPEDYPTPSTTDRHWWVASAGRRADGRPALAVIVGRQSLYVELVRSRSAGQRFVPFGANVSEGRRAQDDPSRLG